MTTLQAQTTHEPAFRTHKKYQNGLFKTKDELLRMAEENGQTHVIRILSFGGGTQSSHLLDLHFKGEINYDYILFSNTGAEPEFIHEQVAWWQKRQQMVGNQTPFIVTEHNSMKRGLEEMLMRYIYTDYQRFQMPLYFNKVADDGTITKGGLMPRQCTGDFKIIPVQQAARRLIKQTRGLTPRQKMPKDIAILMDIGFSADEINRVGGHVSHQSNYIYLAYPLIEMDESTASSITYLMERNYPSKRSRCYFCPFNCSGDRARDIGMDWQEIIDTEPTSFLKAVFFDDTLRQVQAMGVKNMRSIPYFHFSRRPLREVYQNEYEALQEAYAPFMDAWQSEWAQFLSDKYNVPLRTV